MVRAIRFLWVFAISALTLSFSCTRGMASNDPDKPPNIILIMADDLGYETLGANGGTSYQTPHLDQLASGGMRFEHCYSQPLCTPSRVQLMTGIYNVRNYVRFGLLEKSQTTFGHLFQEAGYATCVVGKWQLGKEADSPQQAGFDTHCLWQVGEGRMDSTERDTRFSKPVLEIDGVLKTYEDTDYGPDIACQFGLDFMEKCHRNKKPFLLYYPMILTHCPFSPTPISPEWGSEDSSTMTYKGDPRYFGDMVHYMDHLVGKIIRKLEELGIQDNTLIIFTGDNGTDVPIVSEMDGRKIAGAKKQTTDAGTRVPLIISWPEVIQANVSNSDLIDFTDFLPTLIEAAGLKTDALDLDGRSFLPQLRGETGNPRDWIYCWFSRNGESEKARVFARNHRYKLYGSGEFYDIPADYDEKDPLDLASLDAGTKELYSQLSKVIADYGRRRLDKLTQILIITGGHDFERDAFFDMFHALPGIAYTELCHPGANQVYDSSLLDQTDVLLFYDMVQDITDDEKAAFIEMLEQGKGLVFLHHSLASYQTWEEFEQIIGGKYVLSGRDSSTYRHDVEIPVEILNRDHPVSNGLNDFLLFDEVYGNIRVRPEVVPLLGTTHPESGKIIGWAQTYGNSRIVYLQPGHDHHAYEDPNFRLLLKQAIQWVQKTN